MEKNKDIENILSELDGFDNLKKLKKSQAFSTPETYFEDLESNIMSNILAETQAKTLKLKPKKILMYAAAASIVALFIFIGLRSGNDNGNQPNLAIQPTENVEQKQQIAIEDNPQKVEKKNTNITTVDSSNSNIAIEEAIAHEAIENKESIENPESPKVPSEKPQHYKNEGKEQPIDIVNNDNNSNSSLLGTPLNSQNYTTSNPAAPNSEELAIARKQVNRLLDLGEDKCSNSAVALNAQIIYKATVAYLWSTDDTTASIIANETGVYWVVIMDVKGNLLASDTVDVNIVPSPKPELGEDREICNHESLLLSSSCKNNNYTYEWSNSDLTTAEIYLTDLDPGMHEISITVMSCADTVTNSMVLTVNDCKLKIPNVMTPNGDGKNDRFIIEGLSNYPNSQLYIMDRNGRVVYESLNYQNDWDAGNLPDGTYFYRLIISDKKQTEKAGTISIIGN